MIKIAADEIKSNLPSHIKVDRRRMLAQVIDLYCMT